MTTLHDIITCGVCWVVALGTTAATAAYLALVLAFLSGVCWLADRLGGQNKLRGQGKRAPR